ncbi:putative ankyrin repeat protein L25 [Talaromyces pinophilus]|nr:putative ankyrin repeat protein L25 [Talaromyces pinophilus]
MASRQYAHEDYTIGWICALPKTELVAAAAMLDEEHPILPAADPKDVNSYLLGRIADHNVVIACLPAETTGKVSAAMVATNLIRSFPSIRFGLMVGIGGGFPCHGSQRQAMSAKIDEVDSDDSEDGMDEILDIRLGDVVVSLHTKSTEAVVQYDFGKSLQVKRLQANYARGHHKIPELLSKMLAANPAMAKFRYPGREKDRLFRADFAHLEVLHLSEQIEEVNSGLEKAFEQRENHHRDHVLRYVTEDQRRCHHAFKTSTYEKFKNINPDRVKGTCEWVLNSHEYLRWWKATTNDLLWISADPGCGKSVLTKALIDEEFALSNSNISVVYFYFKDNDEQNNFATALCAVLHQLFSLHPQLLQHALPSWEKNQEKIQYEMDEMWRILMAATSDPACGNTVCVFDALDECRDRDQEQIIAKLRGFHNQCPASQRNWLKFLVTSRPYDDIKEHFRPVTKYFPHIHLRGEEENDQIHKEINLVVKFRVAELGKNLALHADTQARLEKELCGMNHRTYLLRPDRETIPSLPKNVPEAYERILDRIPCEEKAKVKTILRIIVGARRPLTIREMAMALGVATSPDAETATEAGLNPNGLDEKIRDLCGLFVFIKEYKIYLIHQTAREFLISKHDGPVGFHWHLESSKTKTQMTEICIRYLLMNDLVTNDGESVQSLLDYSAENWANHLREVLSPEDKVINWAWKLYDVRTERFRFWFPKFWAAAMPYNRDPKMKALHLAAFNGHPDILCRIGVNKTDAIDCVDGSGTTALQWAAMRGNLEINRLLLEKGADFNAWGSKYGSALQAAAEGGHIEIVQLLLEKGADINAQGGYHGNALQAAATGGHIEIGNALQATARGGYLEVTQYLLEMGADVNAQSSEYSNALQAAAVGGHLEIVQYLIEKGVDVNARDRYYGNALQAAAIGGHLKVTQYLLEIGDDINAQCGFCGNALQAAVEGGQVEIVQHLLEKGAEINAQGGYYGNALQAAVRGGHLQIIQLLIEKGVNVNAQGGKYGNALRAAAVGGNPDIIRLLLEKGADVNGLRV